MGSLTLVAILGVVLQAGAARGQNHQDPQENNDFNHHNNVVVKAASAAEKARQPPRPHLEEQQNDRQASIDSLLEDSVLSPAWAGADDGEESGCAAGTWLTELDVCLTAQQLQHFLPLTGLPLPNTVVSTGLGVIKPLRRRRQVHQLIFSLWTGGVVPYVFNASFPLQDRQLVLSAMAEWERVTCIRFRPATADDKDVVAFRDGKRCSTNIGRVGGQQMMTLAQPCRRKRILTHELGHVLGLIHEHQRQDRDNYVTVMLHNVRTSNQERYQFSKLAPSPQADGLVQYSYTSIMHYGKNYFAKTPELTTLLTADPGYQDVIGRAELPGVSDAEALNIMYGCGGVTANRLPDATCELLKLKGECHSLNRDTFRSLCSRTCHPGHQAHVTSGFFQPSPYGPDTLGADHQQQQQHSGGGPLWVAGSNAVGGQPSGASGLGDSLLNYQQTAASSGRQALWSPGLAPEGRQLSLFGNAPQLRAQPISGGQDMQDPVSSWLLSLQGRPAGPHSTKAAEDAGRKAAEREAGGPEVGGAQEAPLAAHNMKALSPEALPEAMARLTPNDYPVATAPLQATEPGAYAYDRPHELSLLQSMLSPHQPLPTRPAQQGLSLRRPVFRPASVHSPSFLNAQRGAQGFVGSFAVSQPVFHARSAPHNQPEFWRQQPPPVQQTGAVYGRFQPPQAPQRVGSGGPASYQLFLDTANSNSRSPGSGGGTYPLAAVRPDHSFFG